MKSVVVTAVEKVPSGNSERVTCGKHPSIKSHSWGDVEGLVFIAPEGTHRIGQSVTLPEIEGSTGYS